MNYKQYNLCLATQEYSAEFLDSVEALIYALDYDDPDELPDWYKQKNTEEDFGRLRKDIMPKGWCSPPTVDRDGYNLILWSDDTDSFAPLGWILQVCLAELCPNSVVAFEYGCSAGGENADNYGYGGGVVIVTSSSVTIKSTYDLLDEMRSELEKGKISTIITLGIPRDCHDCVFMETVYDSTGDCGSYECIVQPDKQTQWGFGAPDLCKQYKATCPYEKSTALMAEDE